MALLADWLALQCKMIPGAEAGLATLDIDPRGQLHAPVTWPDTGEPRASLRSVAEMALARRVPVVVGQGPGGDPATADGTDGASAPGVDIGFPLLRDGVPFGVVAIAATVPAAQGQSLVQLLRWGATWLELLLRAGAGTSGGAGPGAMLHPDTLVLECLQAALREPGTDGAALAACSLLAVRLGCSRVSLGLHRGTDVALVAISDTASFDRRMGIVRQLEASMAEAVEQGVSIGEPPIREPGAAADSDVLVSSHAHRALREAATAGAVLTVLLHARNGLLGALTFECATAEGLVAIAPVCDSAAAGLGPVLAAKQREERGLLGRLASGDGRRWSTALWPAIGLTLVLATGALALITDTYHVNATAVVEGSVQRAVVVPYDGFLDAAEVRAGDAVRKGQTLARLDARELELEVRRLSSDRQALEKRRRKAFGALDRSQSRILAAQLEQVDARLELAEQRLQRTTLTAPFDGFVVSGDATRSLGRPVERGEVLFELAPLDAYRVALTVDGRDISEVAPGQTGTLRLAALPEVSLPVAVESVAPLAADTDAAGGFRAEARLAGATDKLRPGMHGVARLDAGERSVLSAWLARPLAALRLWWWSTAP